MENQLTRLTSASTTNNSARFENMLMTTRRTPRISGYGAAATLRVVNPVGASSARTSFFARRFSTSATAFTATKLAVARAELVERSATAGTKVVSDVGATFTTHLFKSRTLARARTYLVQAPDEDAIRAPDVRLLRLKSPRNSEYILRLPTQPRSTAVLTGESPRPSRVNGSCAAAQRAARAFTYRTASRNKYIEVTPAPRVSISKRHSSAFSQLRVRVPAYARPATRRIFTGILRAKKRGAYTFIKSFRRNVRAQLRTTMRASVVGYTGSSGRSVLHYRRANKRSPYFYYMPGPTIPGRSIKLRRADRILSKKRLFKQRLARKLVAQQAVYNFRRPFARRTRKLGPKKPGGRKFRLFRNALKFRRKALAIKSMGLFSKHGLRGKGYRLTARKKKRRKFKLKCNFQARASRLRRVSKKLSSKLYSIEKRQTQIMFTERRRSLWGELTLRYMKKERVLKN